MHKHFHSSFAEIDLSVIDILSSALHHSDSLGTSERELRN